MQHNLKNHLITNSLILVLLGCLVYLIQDWISLYENNKLFVTKQSEYKSLVSQQQMKEIDLILLRNPNKIDSQINNSLNLLPETFSDYHSLSGIVESNIDYKIIIPTIQLETNILLSDFTKINNKQDFLSSLGENLTKGVVMFSQNLESTGVTTIYGHSSQLEKDKWFSYFNSLPLLQINDGFSISSNTKQLQYKVIESKELSIQQVDEFRTELQNNNKQGQVLLITCWPLNTSLRRWVVLGQLTQ